MVKKRKRVHIDTQKVEFDPTFFDQAADASASLDFFSPSAEREGSSEPSAGPSDGATPDSSAAATAIESPKKLVKSEHSTMEQLTAERDVKDEHPAKTTGLAKDRESAEAEQQRREESTHKPGTASASRSALRTAERKSQLRRSASPGVIVLGSSDSEAAVIDLCDDNDDGNDGDNDGDGEYEDSDFEILEVVPRRFTTRSTRATRRTAAAAATAATAADSVAHGPRPPPLPKSRLRASTAKRAHNESSTEPDEPKPNTAQHGRAPPDRAHQEASSMRMRSRSEESLRSVPVQVQSHIPGHESSFEVQWSWSQSFFDLRDRLDPDAVLVHNGNKKPWFYSPKKFGDTDNPLALEVFTQEQWEDSVRRAELGDFIIPSSAPDEDGTPDASSGGVAADGAGSAGAGAGAGAGSGDQGFVITIAGKSATVRAMVTNDTSVKQLIDHFKLKTQTPASSQVRAVFDGDTLHETDTIGGLDIEEDDRVDVHID